MTYFPDTSQETINKNFKSLQVYIQLLVEFKFMEFDERLDKKLRQQKERDFYMKMYLRNFSPTIRLSTTIITNTAA